MIEQGNIVTLKYEGKLENGEVFDSSDKHPEPLKFEVGSNSVIKGLDEGIIGMKKGDKKTLNIPCEEAYGEPNPDLIKKVPRDSLPKEQEPEVGMVLMLSLPNGQKFPARIAEVSEDSVSIDMNHFLAGKNLVFDIEVLDVNSK